MEMKARRMIVRKGRSNAGDASAPQRDKLSEANSPGHQPSKRGGIIDSQRQLFAEIGIIVDADYWASWK
jgi:hypothetical protein